MKIGSARNYKSGPKNNWRRATWNEILRRTAGRERQEPILYLTGPQDLDRAIAIEKGVSAHNLIGIDWEQGNVAKVRAGRGLAITGDALDVLWSWPFDRPVAAVLLDFCSGIERTNQSVYDVFERKPFLGSVVMLNFQRGRDPWSDSLRTFVEREAIELAGAGFGFPPGVDGPKNRAFQFLLSHMIDGVSCVAGYGTARSGPLGSARQPSARGTREVQMLATPPLGHPRRAAWQANLAGMMNLLAPRFTSYKSGALTFDSVVFEHHAKVLLRPEYQAMLDTHVRGLEEREVSFREPFVARRIAATLAHRTMRATA